MFSDIKPSDPLWVNLIRQHRSDQDKGVGDTARRLFAKMGGEAFKAFAKSIGLPCGCTERQIEWNERWPY